MHLALRDGVNAWTIDSATLSTIGHLTVSPAPSARSPLVITVTGESTVLGTPGLAAADAGSILWNLPAATSVTVLTPTVGAVLAPSAAVELAADLTGSVVAGSLAQDKGTTVAAAAFAAELPTTAGATDPEGTPEQAAADTTMPGLIAAAEPQADDGLIGVLAVPPATGNNAVITAKVGGDRTGTSGVTSLAGVVLQLYDGTNAPTTPTTAVSPNTCTSDAAGDCSWIVPNTQTGSSGTNRDKRFWVKQVSAPSGWFMNSAFVTGEGDDPTLTTYQFRTGSQLRAGNTYATTGTSPSWMVGTGNENDVASGGIWQNSRTNPTPAARCGLNVALILDVSGSVAPNLSGLKAAAKTCSGCPTMSPTPTIPNGRSATG